MPEVIAPGPADADYDVFVSHAAVDSEATLELVSSLKAELALRLTWEPRIYDDLTEIAIPASINFEDGWRAALDRSTLLVAVMTPNFFVSKWTNAEVEIFRQRELTTGLTLIVPVLLRRGEPPPWLFDRQWLDMSDVYLRHSRERGGWVAHVKRLAETVVLLLEAATAAKTEERRAR